MINTEDDLSRRVDSVEDGLQDVLNEMGLEAAASYRRDSMAIDIMNGIAASFDRRLKALEDRTEARSWRMRLMRWIEGRK